MKCSYHVNIDQARIHSLMYVKKFVIAEADKQEALGVTIHSFSYTSTEKIDTQKSKHTRVERKKEDKRMKTIPND